MNPEVKAILDGFFSLLVGIGFWGLAALLASVPFVLAYEKIKDYRAARIAASTER